MTEPDRWWTTTTIYQVYPRSFQDSNGDGIGDLPGIIDRLDHLVDLGVGTVWVSPFFASPQADFGYDVSDYRDIAPEYGTLADADRLIEEAHRRGLRVMFDLVLNHTSDQHPWFTESRQDRSNAKADWYIWADGQGRNGKRPPNNWRDVFQLHSAWNYDPGRGQWYLASFLPVQPDLNWHHPEVEAELFDTVRFWCRRGVDGFRLDMFGAIMKDSDLRSNRFRPSGDSLGSLRLWSGEFTENTVENMALAKRLRAVCDEFEPERILLGEVFGTTAEVAEFTGGETADGLQLAFLFSFLEYRYSAAWVRAKVDDFEHHFPYPAQPTYVLENHDRSRLVDRVGGNEAKARVMATLLLTLRGVPTIYQGQEIGARNTYIPLADALDPIAQSWSWVPERVSKRLPERVNRDEVRTPMQWTGAEGAGFTEPDVQPWLPLNPDAGRRNVAAQQDDPTSMLALYAGLLHLRRDHAALHAGRLEWLAGTGSDVVAYSRTGDDERLVVVANMGRESTVVAGTGATDILLATDPGVRIAGASVQLPPNSATVLATGRYLRRP